MNQQAPQQTEKISGTIDRFIFQNTDNGFVIFLLTCSAATVTVTGYLPALVQGQEVELEGSWIVHQKFGKQFQALRCIFKLPTSVVGLKKYLGSGLIKGIGKVYAEKLVDHFGSDVLTIISESPNRLLEVPGIGQKRIDSIVQAWQSQKDVAEIMAFLQDKGASPAYAAKIYKQYGQRAIDVIQENPYRLADEVWGIGFAIADTIALNMGFDQNSLKRCAAGVIHTLTAASGQGGHLYLPHDDLVTHAHTLLKLAPEQTTLVIEAIANLVAQQRLVSFVYEDIEYRGMAHLHALERDLANRILRLIEHDASKAINTSEVYDALRVAKPGEIELHEKQQQGIISALSSKVSVITGGPGTGKTTLLRKLLELLDARSIKYRLAAPTGRASKRMSESTGRFAMTIHRLLEFDPATMKFTHNELNALQLDFLIVDEASMIDLFLAHALVRALPQGARLLLIGDSDQLPSVGPGNILKDIIASGSVPCVRLTEIFRQAETSLIVMNAHRVNRGEFPNLVPMQAQRDCAFVKLDSPEAVPALLKRIFFIEAPKRGIDPHDVQILVPMNRGAAGTQVLNHCAQQLLNPDKKPCLMNLGTTFKMGDKVMQIRNNYDKALFNGDMGIIETVNSEEQTLAVKFIDRIVDFEKNELDELVLAYATTIHKSQGSEYAAVVIPLFMHHFILLQRNLVYTALTRAKKLCILIGEPRALAMAVKKSGNTKRVTFLAHFLKTAQIPPSNRHQRIHV